MKRLVHLHFFSLSLLFLIFDRYHLLGVFKKYLYYFLHSKFSQIFDHIFSIFEFFSVMHVWVAHISSLRSIFMDGTSWKILVGLKYSLVKCKSFVSNFYCSCCSKVLFFWAMNTFQEWVMRITNKNSIYLNAWKKRRF